MSAIAAEAISSRQDAPLACLCPWLENPYRLVSLWDMLPFLAYDFCRASVIFGQLYAQIKSDVVPTSGSWGAIAGELGMLERSCEALGLIGTLAQIKRLKPLFIEGSPHVVYADVARDVMEVQTRLVDELQARKIFVIQQELSSYYAAAGINLFGPTVEDAFHSASFDIDEAGKCHAFRRSTACVFHLMRVLEIGLGVFARRFMVPSDHTNWHNIIEGIEKAVRGMGADPNRGADWKEQQEFFSQAASHFMVLKDAWRNYTAHARGKYTVDEAGVIFINVRAFMQKLATRLHE